MVGGASTGHPRPPSLMLWSLGLRPYTAPGPLHWLPGGPASGGLQGQAPQALPCSQGSLTLKVHSAAWRRSPDCAPCAPLLLPAQHAPLTQEAPHRLPPGKGAATRSDRPLLPAQPLRMRAGDGVCALQLGQREALGSRSCFPGGVALIFFFSAALCGST